MAADATAIIRSSIMFSRETVLLISLCVFFRNGHCGTTENRTLIYTWRYSTSLRSIENEPIFTTWHPVILQMLGDAINGTIYWKKPDGCEFTKICDGGSMVHISCSHAGIYTFSAVVDTSTESMLHGCTRDHHNMHQWEEKTPPEPNDVTVFATDERTVFMEKVAQCYRWYSKMLPVIIIPSSLTSGHETNQHGVGRMGNETNQHGSGGIGNETNQYGGEGMGNNPSLHESGGMEHKSEGHGGMEQEGGHMKHGYGDMGNEEKGMRKGQHHQGGLCGLDLFKQSFLLRIWIVDMRFQSVEEKQHTSQAPSPYSATVTDELRNRGLIPQMKPLSAKGTVEESDRETGVIISSEKIEYKPLISCWETSVKLVKPLGHFSGIQKLKKRITGDSTVSLDNCFAQDSIFSIHRVKFCLPKDGDKVHGKATETVKLRGGLASDPDLYRKPFYVKDPCESNIGVAVHRDGIVVSQHEFQHPHEYQELRLPKHFVMNKIKGETIVASIVLTLQQIVLLMANGYLISIPENYRKQAISVIPGVEATNITHIKGRDWCSDTVNSLIDNQLFIGYSHTGTLLLFYIPAEEYQDRKYQSAHIAAPVMDTTVPQMDVIDTNGELLKKTLKHIGVYSDGDTLLLHDAGITMIPNKIGVLVEIFPADKLKSNMLMFLTFDYSGSHLLKNTNIKPHPTDARKWKFNDFLIQSKTRKDKTELLHIIFVGTGLTSFFVWDQTHMYYLPVMGGELFSVQLLDMDHNYKPLARGHDHMIKSGNYSYPERIQQVVVSSDRNMYVLLNSNRLLYGKVLLKTMVELKVGLSDTELLFTFLTHLNTLMTVLMKPGMSMKSGMTGHGNRYSTATRQHYPFLNEIRSTLYNLAKRKVVTQILKEQRLTSECPFQSFEHNMTSKLTYLDLQDSLTVQADAVYNIDLVDATILYELEGPDIMVKNIKWETWPAKDKVLIRRIGEIKPALRRIQNTRDARKVKELNGAVTVNITPQPVSITCFPPIHIEFKVIVGCEPDQRIQIELPSYVTKLETCDIQDHILIPSDTLNKIVRKKYGCEDVKKCKVPYDKNKHGCPYKVSYRKALLPKLVKYNYKGVRTEVEADFIVWDLLGQVDFTFNTTMKQARCDAKSQDWKNLMFEKEGEKPSDLFLSCYLGHPLYKSEWESDETGLAEPYQILNKTNNNSLLFGKERSAIYLFKAAIVDPYYSLCNFETTFVIQTVGLPHRTTDYELITTLVMIAVMLLTFFISYVVYKNTIYKSKKEEQRMKQMKKAPSAENKSSLAIAEQYSGPSASVQNVSVPVPEEEKHLDVPMKTEVRMTVSEKVLSNKT